MEGDFIKIQKTLLPLSWVYGLVVGLRNMLFEIGILKSRSFTVPIISVGNITIGGSGKTPHVEYLIRLLRDKARVAVLSRGYKRKTKGYVLADDNTTSRDIGDEPYQMYSKYGKHDIPENRRVFVAVNANRCKGIDTIRQDPRTKDTDVILLDDAYQHRYVKPGVNILLVDYHRLITYDRLLPAGRLREPQEGKSRADVVIVTKCPMDLKPMEYRVLQKALNLYPYQKLFFTTLVYGELCPVFADGVSFRLSEITDHHSVLLLTGIASPQQLMLDMQHLTPKLYPMSFRDHHQFTSADALKINNLFDSLDKPRKVITTEKDAARLISMDGLSDDVRRNIYALPVEINFMLDQGDAFDEYILSYVQKNSRNSILSKRKNNEERKKHIRQSERNSNSRKVTSTNTRSRTISFK